MTLPLPTGEHQVQCLARRCYATGLLRRIAALSTALLFVAGTVLLVVRGFGGSSAPWLQSAAVLWLAALAVAAVLQFRRGPRPELLRAALDARNACDGLLLAAAECPIGEWAERLAPVRAPRVVWHSRRALPSLAAAIVFATAAALVPLRSAIGPAVRPLEVRETAQALEQRIAQIEEAALIEPAEAEALRAQLERAAEDAAGHDPAKTWEMLDHLAGRAEDAARQALAELVKQSAAAAEAATLAAESLEGVEREGGLADVPSAELEAMLRDLEAALKAGEAGALLDPAIAAWLAEAFKDGGGFTEDQLRRLSEALRETGADLADRLAQARSIRIADPAEIEELIEALRAATQNGTGEGEGEGAGLDLIALPTGAPGRGGISRGGAPAELTFRDEASSAEGAEFKPVALPRGEFATMRDSRRIGVSAVAPDTADAAAPAAPGTLATPTDGGSGRRHTLLPRHRGPVRRYFDRNPGEKTP